MSRIAYLFHRPRRTLAALATVLAATGLTVASGANFTATSANPANTFATGSLTMSNDKAGAAVLSAAGMRPGDAATVGTVDIANTGTLSGAFTLTRGAVDDSDGANPLSGKLRIVVRDCGAFSGSTAPACGSGAGTLVYDGTLAEMGTAGHTIAALGTYSGGDKHRFRFEAGLDASAGNAYQGDSSSVTFSWDAV